jgi:DNA modification methylase
VATLKLGRHFIGCEQDKTYAVLAARRLNETVPGDLDTANSDGSSPVVQTRQQPLFAKA